MKTHVCQGEHYEKQLHHMTNKIDKLLRPKLINRDRPQLTNRETEPQQKQIMPGKPFGDVLYHKCKQNIPLINQLISLIFTHNQTSVTEHGCAHFLLHFYTNRIYINVYKNKKMYERSSVVLICIHYADPYTVIVSNLHVFHCSSGQQ